MSEHVEHSGHGETTPASTPPAGTEPSRRSLLEIATFVLGGLASLAAGIPLLGYFLGPVLRRRRPQWVALGPSSQFPVGQTRLVEFNNPGVPPWDGQSAKSAAYVRSLGNNEFQIFAVNYAHLGCPVSWFPQSGLFMCPCHGGVYYENGERASGPPPRGLYTYEYQVDKKTSILSIQVSHLPTLQDPLDSRRKTKPERASS